MALADVQALFGVGDQGALFDFTDETTLFQDSSRTTAATIGDVVAGVTDLSGNDNHAVQATTSGTPIHRGWPTAVGSNLVTNPFFSADSDWTKGTGWTIASNKATKTAGTAANLTQSISLTAGETYLVNVLFTRTAGSFDVEFQGTTTVSDGNTITTTSGGYYYLLTAVTGNNTISITADSAFAGDIHEVVCQQVTASNNLGLFFRVMNNDKLWTGAFDASATDVGTYGVVYTQAPANGNAFISNFRSATSRPSFNFGPQSRPKSFLYATDSGDTTATDTATIGPKCVAVYKFDLGASTDATRVIPITNGVDKTAEVTYSGVFGSASNWQSSARLTIGGPYTNTTWFHGIIHKVFFINRTLNAAETATLNAWLKDGFVYAALVGDSTHDQNTAADSGASSFQESITGLTSRCIHQSLLVADWGDDISEQTTDWATFPAEDKANVDLVVVGGFANDVKQRVGEGTATVTTILSDLQTFINTIRSDCPNALVYALACTPFKEWSDTTTFPAEAYQGWQDYNAGLSGLTGVDAVIDSFNTELNDGSGNLKAEYQAYDDGVHPNTRSRFVVARAIDAQIETDFFTAATALSGIKYPRDSMPTGEQRFQDFIDASGITKTNELIDDYKAALASLLSLDPDNYSIDDLFKRYWESL